ncbi:MAG: hypothetical protein ABIS36_22860 [Chryseolinea sp.]
MKRFLKLIIIASISVIAVCGTSYLTDTHMYNEWQIVADSEVSWARFTWTGDSIGNQYFEKAAINIPAKIEGLPYNFTFQFDLGSSLTMIYEESANSVFVNYPKFKNRITRLESVLQFWNRHKAFKDLSITFGHLTAKTKDCFVLENFGQQLIIDNPNDTTPIHIGTIGADLFKDKVLVIDYPNQKFAICNSVPLTDTSKFVKIEIDKSGKVILPMTMKNKSYRITFDNGSSIFSIITLAKNTSKFSVNPDVDTLNISSWGKYHDVTGKIVTDTFELAGQRYSNFKVYSNHSGLGIDNNTDGTTGNALFLDKTIVIDFKNKKFAVE